MQVSKTHLYDLGNPHSLGYLLGPDSVYNVEWGQKYLC